jgi:cysteine desulfurase
MRRVYLDNNATTQVAPEVMGAMLPCYREFYGNASSVHWYGQEAKALMDKARQQVATLLNAEPNEIVFTSGGTESDNLAIRGIVDSVPGTGKHIITSQIEHHAVLHTGQMLQKLGIKVTYVPVDAEGLVDPAEIEKSITPETVLISIMHSNNEIGAIQPVQEIGAVARARDIYFHTDAVQAAGKVPLDVEQLGVDLLSIAGHKFHAPKGVGALYIKKGTKIRSLLYGGAHERNRRAGTENIPHIVGLGKAAELAMTEMENNTGRILELRNYFEGEIFRRIPHTSLNGPRTRRIPNTANIGFEQVESEALLINLDLAGVACSTGSACASGSIEPSHVLTALGLPPEQAFSSIRFSLSKFTTREEIEYVLNLLPEMVGRLREMSPQHNKSFVMRGE